jgi:hypothetical protein
MGFRIDKQTYDLTKEVKMKNWMLWIGAMAFVAVCSAACFSSDELFRKGVEKLAPVVDSKPLSDNGKKGLTWPVEHPFPNGAWGNGGESAQMAGGVALKDTPGKSAVDTPDKALTKIQRDQPAGGSMYAASPAGNCADALPLKCGDRLDHSTLVQGRANVWREYSRTQRLESGRETIYVFDAPAAGQVVARLKNLTVDLDLLLLTSCDPISNVAASSTPLDLQTIETVTFATEAGRRYFIVVDGYNGAAGTYTLEVDCTRK